MKAFLRVLTALAARLRGIPPPVSDRDVERAQQDLATTTPEQRVRAREAARRAIAALDAEESVLHDEPADRHPEPPQG